MSDRNSYRPQAGRSLGRATALALLAIIAVPAASMAEPAPCSATPNGDEIAACTQAIDAGRLQGRDLAAAYVTRAYAYTARVELGRALSDYYAAIRADPSYAPAYEGRGLFFRFYPTRAIAEFDDAIRLDPGNARFHVNRGTEYRMLRDFDRAVADANEALRIDPKNADAYDLLGGIDQDRGDLDRALGDFSEAIRLAPGDNFAYFSRGSVYQRKGDLDHALADYDETIRLRPSTRAYEVRAGAFAAKHDYARAIADYDEAIRRVPDDATAFRGRGLARDAAGDAAGGAADLAHARYLTTMNGLPRNVFRALGAVAILSGALVLFGMLCSRRMPVVTALFFASTILAGVLLPQASVGPSLPMMIMGAAGLVVALAARYVGRLAGHWRWIYVIGVLVTLYFEAYIALVEALFGLPSLFMMLPRSAEPPYVPFQLAVIAAFVALCAVALRMFRPPPRGAPA